VVRLASWDSIKQEIVAKSDKLIALYGHAAAPGVRTLEAYHIEMPQPLGIVWFSHCGLKTIEILSSYTESHVQRCGIRTFIHKSMLSGYPTVDRIISGSGTESGKAWMIKQGYTETPDGWVYQRITPEQKASV
jgi:hypothetical protein